MIERLEDDGLGDLVGEVLVEHICDLYVQAWRVLRGWYRALEQRPAGELRVERRVFRHLRRTDCAREVKRAQSFVCVSNKQHAYACVRPKALQEKTYRKYL